MKRLLLYIIVNFFLIFFFFIHHVAVVFSQPIRSWTCFSSFSLPLPVCPSVLEWWVRVGDMDQATSTTPWHKQRPLPLWCRVTWPMVQFIFLFELLLWCLAEFWFIMCHPAGGALSSICLLPTPCPPRVKNPIHAPTRTIALEPLF